MGRSDDDEKGVRTAGRPAEGEARPPERKRRIAWMSSDATVDRLDAWAFDYGVSRSTAIELIVRRRLADDGYNED